MYLLSFLAVVIVSLFTIATTSIGLTGNLSEAYLIYFDVWSFGILIILCFPILISSGLVKDFNNAFRLTVKVKSKTDTEQEEKKRETEVSLPEIKRAIEAVVLVRKVLIAGGTFIVLLTVTFILAYFTSDSDALGNTIAAALLPLVYAFAADIFLLPIEVRLKVRLNDIMHQ